MKNAKIVHKNTDITKLVSKFTWSGNMEQVARTVSFEIAVSPTDKYLPKVTIMNGDNIRLIDKDGKCLYKGIVFNKIKGTTSENMIVISYDYSIYLAKNSGTFNFKSATPKQILDKIAPMIGLKLGEVANPGVKIARVFENDSFYEIIQTAYNIASRSTEKKYFMRFEDDKLSIKEMGLKKSNFIISESSHIYNTEYSESIEEMINQINIYNEKGKKIGSSQNKDDIAKYGIMQSAYLAKNDKKPTTTAKTKLVPLKRVGKIEALGDLACITGNAVHIKDTYTGLVGGFFITADTHTFEKNTHMMSLEVSYNKMVREADAGRAPKK